MRVDLPAPGTPVMPTRMAWPVAATIAQHFLGQLKVAAGVAFYQGNGPSQQHPVACQHALNVLSIWLVTLLMGNVSGNGRSRTG